MTDTKTTPTVVFDGSIGDMIGVCRVCDAGAVRTENWGPLIDGDVCLGCGGPVHELLGIESNDGKP